MEKFTIELENQEITKIGINAIIDFYQTIAIDQLHLPSLHAFATGVESTSLNVVLDIAKDRELAAADVNSMTSFFQKHQVSWGWFVTAASSDRGIKNYGFDLIYETAGMYFDLANPWSNIESNIVIKEEIGTLQNWIEPIVEGFSSRDNGEAYRQLNANLLSKGEKKLRHFTAYHHGEIAASATLFLSGNCIMLHNLATKIKFRNLGIAASLTSHLMSEAKKAGYQHCFLDSSDMAVNLYRKLGFKIYAVTREYELAVSGGKKES